MIILLTVNYIISIQIYQCTQMAPSSHPRHAICQQALVRNRDNIPTYHFLFRLYINALFNTPLWSWQWLLLIVCVDGNSINKFHDTTNNFSVRLLTFVTHCPHTLVWTVLAIGTNNSVFTSWHQLTSVGTTVVALPLRYNTLGNHWSVFLLSTVTCTIFWCTWAASL